MMQTTNGEMSEFIDTYLKENVHYYGPQSEVQIVLESLVYGKRYDTDRPDGFVTHGGMVYLVEHFQYDSSASNKKGSKSVQEDERIKREHYQKLKNVNNGYAVSKMRTETSYENLISNAKTVFLNHYGKIDAYIEKGRELGVISENSKYCVLFFAQDVSPLGSICECANGDLKLITLARSKEFLCVFKKCGRLDYLICSTTFGSTNDVWIVNRKNLDLYLENTIPYAEYRFLPLSPTIMDVKTTIQDR